MQTPTHKVFGRLGIYGNLAFFGKLDDYDDSSMISGYAGVVFLLFYLYNALEFFINSFAPKAGAWPGLMETLSHRMHHVDTSN